MKLLCNVLCVVNFIKSLNVNIYQLSCRYSNVSKIKFPLARLLWLTLRIVFNFVCHYSRSHLDFKNKLLSARK